MAKQLAVKIELFEMGKGMFILRLNDMAYMSVATKIAAALPAGSDSIAIVTPIDTKVFSIAGTGPESEAPATSAASTAISKLTPNGTEASEGDDSADPMDEAMRLAEQADPESKDAKPPTNVRRREKKNDNTPNANCGRCGGSGQVNVVGVNSEATTAQCPVCKGTGAVRKFGVTPQSRGRR